MWPIFSERWLNLGNYHEKFEIPLEDLFLEISFQDGKYFGPNFQQNHLIGINQGFINTYKSPTNTDSQLITKTKLGRLMTCHPTTLIL